MWNQTISIWLKATHFYFVNLISFLPVFPLVYVPFLGNLLLSVMIRQKIQNNDVTPFKAVGECWQYMKTYVILRLSFLLFPAITSPIPVLGEFMEVTYTRYAAMLSNVMVFENVRDNAKCKARCQALVHGKGVAIRTTYTFPILLVLVFLVAWTYHVAVSSPNHPILLLIVPFLFLFPLSNAVNTFLYLELAEELDRDSGKNS